MTDRSLEACPRVGVGVLVFDDDRLLLGKRVGSHGDMTWCPPGGHLEFGETPKECALRELAEETGLIASHAAKGPWSNDIFEKEGKHYITIFMFVTEFTGTPKVMEPEKCLSWRWFPVDQLPEPLFLSLSNLIQKGPLRSLLSSF